MIEIDEGVGGPQPVAKLFPGHRLTGPLEQHRQNLKRLLLKPEPHAVFPQLAGSKIDLEYAETEAHGSAGLWHGMADRRSRVYHPTWSNAAQGRISRNPSISSNLPGDL